MRRLLWAIIMLAVVTWTLFAASGRTWQLQRVGAILRDRIGF